ncbi:beta-ketoacyl-ACP synthase III [Liquorilactobacillus oeni]|uniref:3-oxoacyl-(Acyl carrier protein) synthase III n=1 Tax=Liquorilactobacillus oeni DSM 19972 TaxID=1423777 RepID=A0A0R1MAD8_9LACO|nr:beta-ketoacyl-ACP synthase III [Liquorilactobacillus oeni]KRL04897.1 3-oxoacyl-(acyl carrier protein) synthase III [Liquorilactobacillus oeni DSM 19972]
MVKSVKLAATAHYVPERVVTNDELSNVMETSDEWIKRHTGIETRHYALRENTSDLCAKTALKLLKEAKISADEIDLIIVATITPDALTPSTASLVQQKISATKAFSFDISAACAGFVFALSTAEKFLRQGKFKHAIVIAGEVNSKMMDFKDRTSTVFFGDGAGGVLLSTCEEAAQEAFVAEKLVTTPAPEVIHSGRIPAMTEVCSESYPNLDAFYQNGHAVFDFVISKVPQHIKDFLYANKFKLSELDSIITHQANLRLIERIAKELSLPLKLFAQNVVYYGNTSSAGIPIGLDLVLKSKYKAGLTLLTGFGAGLSYGSILLDLSHFGE